MMNRVLIAPSILSADFLNLGHELESVEKQGADWHHIDVMDGHFVPNLSLGLPIISSLKKSVQIPLDVHIMISNPDHYIERYVKAGSDRLTFHIEAAKNPLACVQSIQKLGAKAGISLNPDTPAKALLEVIPFVDQVLVMSVFPGFGGQQFIPESLKKIEEIKKMITDIGNPTIIVVDGGINQSNFQKVIDAGADALVAGSYIYGSSNRKQAIDSLRGHG